MELKPHHHRMAFWAGVAATLTGTLLLASKYLAAVQMPYNANAGSGSIRSTAETLGLCLIVAGLSLLAVAWHLAGKTRGTNSERPS